jgi:hypothetical protein
MFSTWYGAIGTAICRAGKPQAPPAIEAAASGGSGRADAGQIAPLPPVLPRPEIAALEQNRVCWVMKCKLKAWFGETLEGLLLSLLKAGGLGGYTPESARRLCAPKCRRLGGSI